MVIITADRIKGLRELSQMTQKELAIKLNVTRSSVNAWEMGISIPSTQKIVELALILHTSTDYILGLDDKVTLDLNAYAEDEQSLIYQLSSYFDKAKSGKQ